MLIPRGRDLGEPVATARRGAVGRWAVGEAERKDLPAALQERTGRRIDGDEGHD